MHYTTKVINIAGEACQHYKVTNGQTICGIKLEDIQTRLEYTLDESRLCSECKKRRPVPRLKDWSPRFEIKNGDHAISALSIMHLFYQSLDEQVQLGWGIHEYAYYRICRTTNVLVNPHPIIICVKEEEKNLQVRLSGGDGRVEEELTFELIEEFFPLIKEDFLEHLQLQERTN